MVALAPVRHAVLHAGELNGHAKACRLSSDDPGQNRVGLQGTAGFLNVGRPSLVPKHRLCGPDPELPDVCQVGDDVVGEPEPQIGVSRQIRCHVERQDRERRCAGRA